MLQTALGEYRLAADELTWRFQSADVETGLIRGQSLEGGGSHIFDELASERMHTARISESLRDAMAKRRKIEATMALIGEDRIHLERAFSPFGRVSAVVDNYFTLSGIHLFTVALHTRAAQTAFAKKRDQERVSRFGSAWTIMQWFEDEARSFEKMEADILRQLSHKPVGHVFERMLNEAVVTIRAPLSVYEEHRIARENAIEQAKAAYCDEKCAEAHRKMWGAP